MKKHQEGYVLVYVLVILFVLTALCLVSSTVALRNWRVQNAAVKEMQDRYEAEGRVEVIASTLKGKSFETDEENAVDKLKEFINNSDDLSVDSTLDQGAVVVTADGAKAAYPVWCIHTEGSTRVQAELVLALNVDLDSVDNSIKKLTVLDVAYGSYQLSTASSGEEGSDAAG
mgnify:CR=1 FL=1